MGAAVRERGRDAREFFPITVSLRCPTYGLRLCMDYIQNPNKTASVGEKSAEIPAPARRRLIDTDLEPGNTGEAEKTIGKGRLVNALNLRHFRNEAIRIGFRRIGSGQPVTFEGFPQPCFGKYLVCLWKDPPGAFDPGRQYELTEICFPGGKELVRIKPDMRAISARGVCVRLPDKAALHSARKEMRHKCESVRAQVLQSSVALSGTLVEFSPSAFCVELPGENPTPIQWLNDDQGLTLILQSGQEVLYSGECRVVRKILHHREKKLVLAPIKDAIQRFTAKIYRSRRIYVSPTPNVVFRHPLTGATVHMKAHDISGAGLSLEDPENSSTLIAGIVIPEMTLCFANAFRIPCRAQVIYRQVIRTERGGEHAKIGIAFLDMEPNDHMRLLSMLHQAENKHLYICNQVDIDSLWAFFFETGFIYPKKYVFIQPHREEIKQTYKKLYTCQSPVMRHFTWQNNGTIMAHLSMLRFYTNTWLIHHLASRTDRRPGTGMEIVDQIGAFTYDTHRLASSHMAYTICYFRPGNRFPNRFFGGVAKNINNPRACSIDGLAYYHARLDPQILPLRRGWSLVKAKYEDLAELENAYTKSSNGLMLQSLDLVSEPGMEARSDLSDMYQEMGLKRERRVFALRHEGVAKAVIMANISDFAMNLSDLTNCVNIFVIDPETPFDILKQSVSMLADLYENHKIPVLLFPLSYARAVGRKYERVYALWALNMEYTDEFFKNYRALK